jgi:hypothetical protein
MPNLKKYWDEVHKLETGLPDFVWLTSLQNPARGQVGGRITQVSAQVGARLIHAGSHRPATEEETQAHLAEEDLQKREAFRQRLQRQGIVMVPVSRDPKTAPK